LKRSLKCLSELQSKNYSRFDLTWLSENPFSISYPPGHSGFNGRGDKKTNGNYFTGIPTNGPEKGGVSKMGDVIH
jgi:hypothetical protein